MLSVYDQRKKNPVFFIAGTSCFADRCIGKFDFLQQLWWTRQEAPKASKELLKSGKLLWLSNLVK